MKENMQTFYKNKKVLITGHTGFKGSWMVKVLEALGADVYGYALEPPTNPSLFEILHLEQSMTSEVGDIRDLEHLMDFFTKVQPEIVIHMAAQPIVRTSYEDPVGTYASNVMGTVHVLECVRKTASVKSFVNVTTDKVYRNYEWERGYKEDDELCGYDPYSNSKSCSELVTDSYRNSFFGDRVCPISTCRAGNVIGGGDFAKDRIIPDCVRAMEKGEEIIVRNPYSTRPYQHVLEPVVTYLKLAMLQYENPTLASAYNIGPNDEDCYTTGKLVDLFCEKWGQGVTWKNVHDGGPHEANFLKLDCSKLKETLNWKPKWNVEQAMEKIVAWYQCYLDGKDVKDITEEQVREYIGL